MTPDERREAIARIIEHAITQGCRGVKPYERSLIAHLADMVITLDLPVAEPRNLGIVAQAFADVGAFASGAAKSSDEVALTDAKYSGGR